jgi:hypothetical protein
MSRRKGEITARINERDFPHIVELALPSADFSILHAEFEAFHRDRGIPARRGRGRNEAAQFYLRFCFSDAVTADAFRERFGGERLPKTGPRRSQPSVPNRGRRYSPRIIDGKARTPADLRRLYSYTSVCSTWT